MTELNEVRLAIEEDIRTVENRLKVLETSAGCLLREIKDVRKFYRACFEDNKKGTIYHPKLGRIQGEEI
jgi:uncharacterized protein (DUF3084 family)